MDAIFGAETDEDDSVILCQPKENFLKEYFDSKNDSLSSVQNLQIVPLKNESKSLGSLKNAPNSYKSKSSITITKLNQNEIKISSQSTETATLRPFIESNPIKTDEILVNDFKKNFHSQRGQYLKGIYNQFDDEENHEFI